MSAQIDEMERWSADWRSTAPEPARPLTSVRARFRRYVALAVANWMIGLFMVVVTTALAWGSGRPELTAAAIATWVFALLATLADLVYRRGTWRSTSRTVLEFLDLAHRRLEAQLRGVRFGFNLLALQTIFFSVWIPWVLRADPSSGLWDYLRAFGFLAAMVTIFAFGLASLRKNRRRQLDQVGDLRAELRANSVSDESDA